MNSIDKMLKPVEKMMKPVTKMLKNRNIRLPIIILLIVYISSALPELTRSINTFMNNLVVRLLVLAGVVYLAQKDILVALLLLTVYIMTSRKVSEYMTDMAEKDGDKKEEDKKEEDKKEENKEEEDKKDKEMVMKIMEKLTKEEIEKLKKTITGMSMDKLREMVMKMKSMSVDEIKNMINKDSMENKEEFSNILGGKCVPEGYNSPYNCYSNERNVSPYKPCGEVRAFDREMSAQGLKGVMGYAGDELSKF